MRRANIHDVESGDPFSSSTRPPEEPKPREIEIAPSQGFFAKAAAVFPKTGSITKSVNSNGSVSVYELKEDDEGQSSDSSSSRDLSEVPDETSSEKDFKEKKPLTWRRAATCACCSTRTKIGSCIVVTLLLFCIIYALVIYLDAMSINQCSNTNANCLDWGTVVVTDPGDDYLHVYFLGVTVWLPCSFAYEVSDLSLTMFHEDQEFAYIKKMYFTSNSNFNTTDEKQLDLSGKQTFHHGTTYTNLYVSQVPGDPEAGGGLYLSNVNAIGGFLNDYFDGQDFEVEAEVQGTVTTRAFLGAPISITVSKRQTMGCSKGAAADGTYRCYTNHYPKGAVVVPAPAPATPPAGRRGLSGRTLASPPPPASSSASADAAGTKTSLGISGISIEKGDEGGLVFTPDINLGLIHPYLKVLVPPLDVSLWLSQDDVTVTSAATTSAAASTTGLAAGVTDSSSAVTAVVMSSDVLEEKRLARVVTEPFWLGNGKHEVQSQLSLLPDGGGKAVTDTLVQSFKKALKNRIKDATRSGGGTDDAANSIYLYAAGNESLANSYGSTIQRVISSMPLLSVDYNLNDVGTSTGGGSGGGGGMSNKLQGMLFGKGGSPLDALKGVSYDFTFGSINVTDRVMSASADVTLPYVIKGAKDVPDIIINVYVCEDKEGKNSATAPAASSSSSSSLSLGEPAVWFTISTTVSSNTTVTVSSMGEEDKKKETEVHFDLLLNWRDQDAAKLLSDLSKGMSFEVLVVERDDVGGGGDGGAVTARYLVADGSSSGSGQSASGGGGGGGGDGDDEDSESAITKFLTPILDGRELSLCGVDLEKVAVDAARYIADRFMEFVKLKDIEHLLASLAGRVTNIKVNADSLKMLVDGGSASGSVTVDLPVQWNVGVPDLIVNISACGDASSSSNTSSTSSAAAAVTDVASPIVSMTLTTTVVGGEMVVDGTIEWAGLSDAADFFKGEGGLTVSMAVVDGGEGDGAMSKIVGSLLEGSEMSLCGGGGGGGSGSGGGNSFTSAVSDYLMSAVKKAAEKLIGRLTDAFIEATPTPQEMELALTSDELQAALVFTGLIDAPSYLSGGGDSSSNTIDFGTIDVTMYYNNTEAAKLVVLGYPVSEGGEEGGQSSGSSSDSVSYASNFGLDEKSANGQPLTVSTSGRTRVTMGAVITNDNVPTMQQLINALVRGDVDADAVSFQNNAKSSSSGGGGGGDRGSAIGTVVPWKLLKKVLKEASSVIRGFSGSNNNKNKGSSGSSASGGGRRDLGSSSSNNNNSNSTDSVMAKLTSKMEDSVSSVGIVGGDEVGSDIIMPCPFTGYCPEKSPQNITDMLAEALLDVSWLKDLGFKAIYLPDLSLRMLCCEFNRILDIDIYNTTLLLGGGGGDLDSMVTRLHLPDEQALRYALDQYQLVGEVSLSIVANTNEVFSSLISEWLDAEVTVGTGFSSASSGGGGGGRRLATTSSSGTLLDWFLPTQCSDTWAIVHSTETSATFRVSFPKTDSVDQFFLLPFTFDHFLTTLYFLDQPIITINPIDTTPSSASALPSNLNAGDENIALEVVVQASEVALTADQCPLTVKDMRQCALSDALYIFVAQGQEGVLTAQVVMSWDNMLYSGASSTGSSASTGQRIITATVNVELFGEGSGVVPRVDGRRAQNIPGSIPTSIPSSATALTIPLLNTAGGAPAPTPTPAPVAAATTAPVTTPATVTATAVGTVTATLQPTGTATATLQPTVPATTAAATTAAAPTVPTPAPIVPSLSSSQSDSTCLTFGDTLDSFSVDFGSTIKNSVDILNGIDISVKMGLFNTFAFPLTLQYVVFTMTFNDPDGANVAIYNLSPKDNVPIATDYYKDLTAYGTLQAGQYVEITDIVLTINDDKTAVRLYDEFQLNNRLCGSVSGVFGFYLLGEDSVATTNATATTASVSVPFVFEQPFSMPELNAVGTDSCVTDVSSSTASIANGGDGSAANCTAETAVLFDYQDSFPETDWVTLKNAKNEATDLRIVNNDQDNKGAAWLTTHQINTTDDWHISFSFKSGPSGQLAAGDADGFVFVLQDSPEGLAALGEKCGGDSYCHGYKGITNSLGLMFDVYMANEVMLWSNGETSGSPSADALGYSGTSVLGGGGGLDFGDGETHSVSVWYSQHTRQLAVYYDDDFSLPLLNAEVIMSHVIPSGKAYVGFTGSTGSRFYSRQRITAVRHEMVVTVPESSQVVEDGTVIGQASTASDVVALTVTMDSRNSCGLPIYNGGENWNVALVQQDSSNGGSASTTSSTGSGGGGGSVQGTAAPFVPITVYANSVTDLGTGQYTVTFDAGVSVAGTYTVVGCLFNGCLDGYGVDVGEVKVV